ncbi:hypothetical protein [Pandoraea norimbergensis]|nr:hypothetical protein [Pandoraea norimbergensis]
MKFHMPVCINVLSPLTLTSERDFLDVVQTFCNFLPEICPEKWGWWEPLDRRFDGDDVTSLVPDGGNCQTVYWQRKRQPKAEGSFNVRWHSKSSKVEDTHSKIGFSFELGRVQQESLVAYLKNASIRTKADFSFVDVLTPGYRDFAVESESAPYGDRFMVVTHLLRHWLPDVFWGTVFGPPYVRLLGKDRLLTAPAFLVEELGPETIYVQLTERLEDAVEDSAKIQASRELFKRHLRSNAFFIRGQGYDRLQRGAIGDVFAVPRFELSED